MEGRLVYDGAGADEACVLAMTKEMEYERIVPLFPTGAAARDAAQWLVGKPFTAGFTVATAATLRAEQSAGAAAAAERAAKAAEEGDAKKGRAKGKARRGPRRTAVQEYGVGIRDAVLGEETDRNRAVAEVPLDALWTHWTAVGGQKRSREEQEALRRECAEHAREAEAAAEKKAAKKARKDKKKEKEAEEEEEQVQEPEKKRSRKGSKKHTK